MQYYKIAGLIVGMESYGRIVEQAKPYLCECDGSADIVITSAADIVKSRYPSLSDEEAEYLGTGASFYKELLNYSGFQLHSSAVVVDGHAYLFTAKSGTGKSTHTGLWMKQFGDRAYILNDDKPALRRINGGWYAYGTPWSGKNDLSADCCVPVAGIACLERGQVNSIEEFDGIDAVKAITLQTNRPKAAAYRIKLLELLDTLIRDVPVWKLKCNMDPEAAIVSYEAMSGRKFEEK